MRYSYDDLGFWGCSAVLIVVMLLFLGQAWLVQVLWNWLSPIFWSTAPMLTYKQAVGITALIAIIGGFFRSSNN